ncbi:MAG: methyltransferase [Acholeplasmatales bacterium]|jgi:tRNA1(Val) A37 N6-methylase TrmN6|nr:methyltransferase [Acholeplasmatales bacterium]
MKNLLGTPFNIEGQDAFNLDTIILADFTKLPRNTKTILDFGTGAGALMFYLSLKNKTSKIIGIEIQEKRALLAKENIIHNHLEDRLSVLNEDIRNIKFEEVDFIICNPPFFKYQIDSNISKFEEQQIARHEIYLTLEDVIKKISECLKCKGQFSIIHRPSRLEEILRLFAKYNLVLKRLKFVYPKRRGEANHLLIQGGKGYELGLIIEPPLFVYENDTTHTEEMTSIYKGRSYSEDSK